MRTRLKKTNLVIVSLGLGRNDVAQSLIFYLPKRERSYISLVPQVKVYEALPNNKSAKNRLLQTEVSTRSLLVSHHNLLVEKGKVLLSLPAGALVLSKLYWMLKYNFKYMLERKINLNQPPIIP